MKRLITSALALALSGCVTDYGRVASVSHVDPDTRGELLATNVYGQDCLHQLVFIPLGKVNPKWTAAIRQAVRKIDGGEYMTDVELTQHSTLTFVYNVLCLRVEGDVRGKAES